MAVFAVFADPWVRAESVFITAVITWAGQMANLLPASLLSGLCLCGHNNPHILYCSKTSYCTLSNGAAILEAEPLP